MKLHVVYVGSDAEAFLQPLRAQLAPLGFQVHHTIDMGAAAALIRQVEASLIIVDISLPDMNGLLCCHQLRAAFPSTCIVALGRGEPDLYEAALAVGVDLVLNVPVEWHTLSKWTMPRVNRPRHPQDADFLLGSTTNDFAGTTAILSHDLKSPISIIISTLEVLISIYESDPSMASSLRLVRGALSAAYRQMNMVSDFLDLIRLEMDIYELDCHPADLAELVREALQIEASVLSSKRLRVEVELPTDTPLIASVDHGLFGRMCSALLDNVVKFTVHDDLLRVSGHRDGDMIVLSFADTGRPIYPGYERQILERAPHWQSRQAGTRTSVAMGLPFVYRAAKAQDGDLQASSDSVTGLTTFTLRLPALDPQTKQGENNHG